MSFHKNKNYYRDDEWIFDFLKNQQWLISLTMQSEIMKSFEHQSMCSLHANDCWLWMTHTQSTYQFVCVKVQPVSSSTSPPFHHIDPNNFAFELRTDCFCLLFLTFSKFSQSWNRNKQKITEFVWQSAKYIVPIKGCCSFILIIIISTGIETMNFETCQGRCNLKLSELCISLSVCFKRNLRTGIRFHLSFALCYSWTFIFNYIVYFMFLAPFLAAMPGLFSFLFDRLIVSVCIFVVAQIHRFGISHHDPNLNWQLYCYCCRHIKIYKIYFWCPNLYQ